MNEEKENVTDRRLFSELINNPIHPLQIHMVILHLLTKTARRSWISPIRQKVLFPQKISRMQSDVRNIKCVTILSY